MEGGWHSRDPPDKAQQVPGLVGQNRPPRSCHPLRRPLLQEVLSLRRAGAGWPGLRGVAYGPSLLLVLRPLACLVLAATATTSAAASLLLGQQALPLGFVV